MIKIDADAAGKVLFDETFAGTLPLMPTWEEQPEAFRNVMRTRAARIARAGASEVPDEEVPEDETDEDNEET